MDEHHFVGILVQEPDEFPLVDHQLVWPAQQLDGALPRPCEHFLPPFYGLSILCGFL